MPYGEKISLAEWPNYLLWKLQGCPVKRIVPVDPVLAAEVARIECTIVWRGDILTCETKIRRI